MVVLYVVGYIVIASSKTVEAVCAGEVIYTPGSTGIDFLAGVIVADITSLQWRALVNNLVGSVPWLVNVFISTYITTGIAANTSDGWRWGVRVLRKQNASLLTVLSSSVCLPSLSPSR